MLERAQVASTTRTSLHYMHIPAHRTSLHYSHIPALDIAACRYGNTSTFMYVFYTHTSITCFAHTHACTLGPHPLRPPRGVVRDLQYIHSTDANRRDFIILSPCTSHHNITRRIFGERERPNYIAKLISFS